MLLHLIGLLDRVLNSQVTGAKPLQVQLSPVAGLANWPAAGLMDTEIRCFIELEEQHATKKAQPRVQA